MEHQLIIKVNDSDTLGAKGFSRVDFIAETNPGEGFSK